MSGYILNGKKIKRVGVLSEPNSYQATLTPENMQRGMTAVVKGKIMEGTGECFEFAEYGQTSLYPIYDEHGEERYGFIIEQNSNANMVFVSSTEDSDTITQNVFIIGELQKGKVTQIGANKTTLTDVIVFQQEGALAVYSVDIANENTTLNFFIGKDNEI